jgi:hypothetical protein
MLINSKKILLIFLFLHTVLWTTIPSLINTNLPLDTIEALAWGNELKLGYDKYPPIFPLFTELFFKLFNSQDWAYYFLSQIFIVICFLIVFKFSQYFLRNDIHCLISVLLLESIYFYNYTSPELNAFIPLFPFLAITALFCWRSIQFNNNFDWIMFGVFAGISTLTYYLALYFLASISIFFVREIIINKKINYKYFIALSVYFLVLSPHLYFLYDNNFRSIEYAFFRSFSDPLSGINDIRLFDHLFYPLIFLIKQIAILTPLIILIYLIIADFKIKQNLKDQKFVFLFSIAILPILLMFLTSAIGGVRVRTMWMTTFYVFPGVFFVYLFSSKIILKNLKKFFISITFILFSLPIVYGTDSYLKKSKRTDFPGKKIAAKIQTVWDSNYSNKIDIVAGKSWVYGGWYSGNLSYHLKDRPKLRYKLNDNDINKAGTIWVDALGNIKFCKGVILKLDPYYESCLVGEK